MLRFVSATIVVAFWLLAMLGDQFVTQKQPGRGRLQVRGGIGVLGLIYRLVCGAGWIVLKLDDHCLTNRHQPTSTSIPIQTNKRTNSGGTTCSSSPSCSSRSSLSCLSRASAPAPAPACGWRYVTFCFCFCLCLCFFVLGGRVSLSRAAQVPAVTDSHRLDS